MTVAVALTLTLDEGRVTFAPGARVSGVADWSSPFAPLGMELRLVWTTHGPGGRDFKIADTLPFATPLAAERRPFSLALPRSPYTFRGHLLALVWTIELVALPGEEKTFVELTIAPGAQAIDLRADALRARGLES